MSTATKLGLGAAVLAAGAVLVGVASAQTIDEGAADKWAAVRAAKVAQSQLLADKLAAEQLLYARVAELVAAQEALVNWPTLGDEEHKRRIAAYDNALTLVDVARSAFDAAETLLTNANVQAKFEEWRCSRKDVECGDKQ